MIIYAGIKGFLDDIPAEQLGIFETQFYQFMANSYASIESDIQIKKELSDDVRVQLDRAITAFKSEFLSRMKK